MYEELNRAFTLRVKTHSAGTVVIHAYDSAKHATRTHFGLELEVRAGGKVVFPRGQLYGGIPTQHCTDSDYAKAHALLQVAMAPGDTDEDYFADYTEEQIAFAQSVKDELYMTSVERYGEF